MKHEQKVPLPSFSFFLKGCATCLALAIFRVQDHVYVLIVMCSSIINFFLLFFGIYSHSFHIFVNNTRLYMYSC